MVWDQDKIHTTYHTEHTGLPPQHAILDILDCLYNIPYRTYWTASTTCHTGHTGLPLQHTIQNILDCLHNMPYWTYWTASTTCHTGLPPQHAILDCLYNMPYRTYWTASTTCHTGLPPQHAIQNILDCLHNMPYRTYWTASTTCHTGLPPQHDANCTCCDAGESAKKMNTLVLIIYVSKPIIYYSDMGLLGCQQNVFSFSINYMHHGWCN